MKKSCVKSSDVVKTFVTKFYQLMSRQQALEKERQRERERDYELPIITLLQGVVYMTRANRLPIQHQDAEKGSINLSQHLTRVLQKICTCGALSNIKISHLALNPSLWALQTTRGHIE